MIKIALGIIIAVLCGYVGFGIEKYYNTRLKITVDYLNFMKYAERETDFLKTGIDELINKFNYATSELKTILYQVINNLELECKYLNKSTLNAIKTFMETLSKTDYYHLTGILKHSLQEATILCETAEKEKIQKGELSRKLIIVIGIALVILVI